MAVVVVGEARYHQYERLLVENEVIEGVLDNRRRWM
jgi:hypothetical protein